MGSRDDIITVYLDDQPHRVMRWMEVRHLYTDLPDDLQLAVEQGTAIIQDEHGNRVGSSGALLEGARYYIVDIKGQSSRMNRQDAKDAKM